LEHVSAIWRNESTIEPNDSGTCQDRCVFHWLSAIDDTQDDPKYIKALFDKHIVANTGWKLTEDHPKPGWMPGLGQIGASLTLEFVLQQPVQTVTMFSMRSYGNWEGSHALVQVSIKEKDSSSALASRELVAFHEKHTSEIYTEEFKLTRRADVHEVLRVNTTLTRGYKFKIMGLAVCS
jgi:hypothetical protein